jgi:hypothetical protein
MEQPSYVPIVKAKRNDLNALRDVPSSKRDGIRPLLELAEYESTDHDETLSEFTNRLAAFTWPHAPYIDLYSFLPDAAVQNGRNATTEGFKLIASRGIHAIPTYGLQRNDALWGDLGKIAAQLNSGFCFRIDIEDLDDQSEDSWVAIIERSAEMNLPPTAIDIVLDLRSIGDIHPTTLDNLVRNFLDYKPHEFAPRFIAIAGSSALKDVGRVPKHGTLAVRRQELLLWTRLQDDWASATKLGFSDYGVIHPDFSQNIPAINANAKIRYTRGQSIHYFRGVGLYKPSNFGQYHDVAGRVIQSPHYRGHQYSAGDKKIWDCAKRNCGTGNLGTWVRADQNHHIETTVEQIGFLTRRLASGIDASAVDVLFQEV